MMELDQLDQDKSEVEVAVDEKDEFEYEKESGIDEVSDDKEINEIMEPVEITSEEVSITAPVGMVNLEPDFSEQVTEETVKERVVDKWGVTRGRKEDDFW